MISTRVMDIKLREAAEGLGEDSTGKALTSPALGRAHIGLWGKGSQAFALVCVEGRGSVQSVQVLPCPSYCNERAHPDCSRPLKAVLLCFAVKHRGF